MPSGFTIAIYIVIVILLIAFFWKWHNQQDYQLTLYTDLNFKGQPNVIDVPYQTESFYTVAAVSNKVPTWVYKSARIDVIKHGKIIGSTSVADLTNLHTDINVNPTTITFRVHRDDICMYKIYPWIAGGLVILDLAL